MVFIPSEIGEEKNLEGRGDRGHQDRMAPNQLCRTHISLQGKEQI